MKVPELGHTYGDILRLEQKYVKGIKSPTTRTATTKIGKFFENRRIQKHEAEVDKFVHIDKDVPLEAQKELYPTRDGLARHAKANGVEIGFTKVPDKENQMIVMVRDKEGRTRANVLNSDVNAMETVERERPRMLENKDGLNYEFIGTETKEDGFLGRVYRTVDTLIHSINKK